MEITVKIIIPVGLLANLMGYSGVNSIQIHP